MSRLSLRISRSENYLRCLRSIYGAPYGVEALCHKGLKGAYTVFTDFFNTMLYIRERKNNNCECVLARVREKSHRKIRKNRKTCSLKPYKSTLLILYGLKNTP